jgi:hypothetical protein
MTGKGQRQVRLAAVGRSWRAENAGYAAAGANLVARVSPEDRVKAALIARDLLRTAKLDGLLLDYDACAGFFPEDALRAGVPVLLAGPLNLADASHVRQNASSRGVIFTHIASLRRKLAKAVRRAADGTLGTSLKCE